MIIQVSSLNDYSFCPRAVYLSKVLGVKPKMSRRLLMGSIWHFIMRELSIRQHKFLNRITDGGEIRILLSEELEKILRDLPFIYGHISKDDLDEFIPILRKEIQNDIDVMSNKLNELITRFGIEDALRMITPWKVEFQVNSRRLGMRGRIDKVMRNPDIFPVEIKTGKCPETDVWNGNKLQLCAYAMLLEDRFNSKVNYGLIEYTRIQEERRVVMTSALRRNVLEVRDMIIDIINGHIPERIKNSNKCNSCVYRHECGDL
ncbi:MAG: CRISPR-associated protein Cas4 [Candidatus Altiarchaeales archaeon]|nr:MAG: CRISPR-associated protein Cas4 [Candidatus Altiarchaeales archaeon]